MKDRLSRESKNLGGLIFRISTNLIILGVIYVLLVGWENMWLFASASIILSILWGTGPFVLAAITTAPILLMTIWLYALIGIAGYGLNMVTVSIAAISLGVGIDYVIHVIERFREEMESGVSTIQALGTVGGASGLALFGSAVSDMTGFMMINQSEMGFFSTFGLFCAIMIALSLIASMVLSPSVLGFFYKNKNFKDVGI